MSILLRYGKFFRRSKMQGLLITPIENLISEKHPYRKFISLLNFDELTNPIKELENTEVGRHGYGISSGFRMLLLQFLEDLSDRELERYLQENIAGKWFCGFELEAETPDFSYFSKLRAKIGTHRLATLFNRVQSSLKQQGVLREIFSFVDSSQLISKLSVWEERDKAIKAGLEKFNNETAPKVSVDKEARLGCKGKNKYWFGYKRHVSVDMQSGLINKVAVTLANISDAKGLKHTCPKEGAIYGDKAYCLRPAQRVIAQKGCHDATIKMNHMLTKNRDKGRWLSKCRAPYERVFSKVSKRARCHGIAKNQFQGFMQALAHNLKRLAVLQIAKIDLVATAG